MRRREEKGKKKDDREKEVNAWKEGRKWITNIP